MLTPDRLRELLDYDPETGVFIWKQPKRTDLRGKQAGAIVPAFGIPYRRIKIATRAYKAHRLAWLYVYGEWPVGNLDHINHDGGDNRIANLRQATFSQNNANARIYKNNRLGLRGISPWGKKFAARVMKDGISKFLGVFDTPQEAYAVYRVAARELYGEFAGV